MFLTLTKSGESRHPRHVGHNEYESLMPQQTPLMENSLCLYVKLFSKWLFYLRNKSNYNKEDGGNQFPEDPFTLEQRKKGAGELLCQIRFWD